MGSPGKSRVPPPPPPPPPEPTRQPEDEIRQKHEARKSRFRKRSGRADTIKSKFGELADPENKRKTLLGG